MDNIVIFGASGHAKVIIDVVEKECKFCIAGIVDRTKSIGEEFLGYKVIGKDEDIIKLVDEYQLTGGIVAIGDNYMRSKVVTAISSISRGFKFVSSVHPSANIAKIVTIGDGTVIMAGASVNPCCTLGKHVIINTNASIDHDSVMDDFSSLGPRSVTGGNVHVGKFTAIGIGATLIQNIAIGENTVIGAGATVVKDVCPNVVAFGVPAKNIRNREVGEKYL